MVKSWRIENIGGKTKKSIKLQRDLRNCYRRSIARNTPQINKTKTPQIHKTHV
jgi:hypothetical protein